MEIPSIPSQPNVQPALPAGAGDYNHDDCGLHVNEVFVAVCMYQKHACTATTSAVMMAIKALYTYLNTNTPPSTETSATAILKFLNSPLEGSSATLISLCDYSADHIRFLEDHSGIFEDLNSSKLTDNSVWNNTTSYSKLPQKLQDDISSLTKDLKAYAEAPTPSAAQDIAKLLAALSQDASGNNDAYAFYLHDFLSVSVYTSPGGDSLAKMAAAAAPPAASDSTAVWDFEIALKDLGEGYAGAGNQGLLSYILSAVTSWDHLP